MAFDLHRPGFQFAAKSQGANNPVASGKLAGAPVGYGTSVEQAVALPSGIEPWGVAKVGSYVDGDRMTVYEAGNYVKAVAAVSLGWNADVHIASTNGALGPIAPASGAVGWVLGKAMDNAAAGGVFTILIKPYKKSNP